MRKYVIKRLLLSVLILVLVTLLIYGLMRALPTSYIEAIARQKSQQPGSRSYEEWMELLTASYGFDKGILAGYLSWAKEALKLNFGDSWFYTVPVTEKFNSVIWTSFTMSAISMFFEIAIAIPLGIIAATHQYQRADNIISVIAIAGISLPTFFFASLLKLVFSVKLGWFDLYGMIGRNYEQLDSFGKFLDKAHHMVLPIVTLVVISIGGLMRYTRTNMLEVMNADYIRTARAKGVSEKKVIYRRIAAGLILRCADYRNLIRNPGYRSDIVQRHGRGGYPVLHVLSDLYGSADAVRKPHSGYSVRGS